MLADEGTTADTVSSRWLRRANVQNLVKCVVSNGDTMELMLFHESLEIWGDEITQTDA